jgi:uncharacterized membrane protein YeaQ/YmgE (transglycosylase-associated protein family)
MELSDLLAQWANDVLLWVGFGTVVGLIAKAVMPGRDPGGAVATLLTGIAGTVIGSGTLMLVTNGRRVTPISPLGFVVAVAGALVLLFFYRLLAGRILREGGYDFPRWYRRYRGRRRVTVLQDE